MSEGKPSLFLARFRALNDGSCTDTILKSVFLKQMPSQIRAILAMSNVDNLQELANTGLIYLIDTGSDISLLPADSKTLKKFPSEVVLFAANDSRVHTFDEREITFNLNLRRNFKWNFCVAQVPYPIIGVDLLAHFHLVPFLHESRLVDTTTG